MFQISRIAWVLVTRVVIVLFALALLLIPSAQISAQQPLPTPWDTKEFEILWHSPSTPTRVAALEELFSLVSPTPAERIRKRSIDQFLRSSLAEIAEFYESKNIKQPLLPKRKGKDEIERWQVYAYDFDSGFYVNETEEFAAGYYTSGLCLSIPWIFEGTSDLNPFKQPALSIDIAKLVKAKDLNETELSAVFATLAHELFHAIQAAYDLKWSSTLWCKEISGNGFWPLIEGTATMATRFVMENKDPDYYRNKDTNHSNVGAFPYSEFDFLTVGGLREERQKGNDPSLSYKTSSFWTYIAKKYGGLKVYDDIFSSPLVPQAGQPTLADRYKWLNRNVRRLSGKELYLVLPEFFAEFGSYPDSSMYELPMVSESKWLKTIYRKGLFDCHSVELTKANGGTDALEITVADGFFPNGPTCIELNWSGILPPFAISVEAEYPEDRILDQLHLGVARISTGGHCIDWIDWAARNFPGEVSQKDFDCTFGKIYLKIGELKADGSTDRYRKNWSLGWPALKDSFFNEKLEESGSAIFILSNVAVDPSKTLIVPPSNSAKDKVTVRFSKQKLYSADGRSFKPPTYLETNLPILPNSGAGLSVPGADLSNSNPFAGLDRYSFYGIVTGTRILPIGYGAGFEAIASDSSGKKYSVIPHGDKKFEYGIKGPRIFLVSNESGASSATCSLGTEPVPNGEVTRSDEFQLRFSVKTDLCTLDTTNIRKPVPIKVDSFEAEFVMPFARRYYRETEQRDLVTPGTELYIDEFLRDSAILGIPIPPGVLLSDGSYPGGQSGTGAGGGDGGGKDGNTKGGKDGKSSGGTVCTCSCDEYKRIRKALEEAKKSKSEDPKILSEVYCMQKCMSKFLKCPQK